MHGLALSFLGFVLNGLASGSDFEVENNVTAVLGEEVVLRCQFTGSAPVFYSSWVLEEANGIRKRVAGYNQNKPFSSKQNIGLPVSPSNLTVTMNVSSLEDEGTYECSFLTEDLLFKGNLDLTVLVRPAVQTQLEEEVENGTHYQTVSCSAVAAKPAAAVTWWVNESFPFNASGALNVTTTHPHPNGTVTTTSVLRFPTHLQDEGQVTCNVRHVTLTEPASATIKVQTFACPSISPPLGVAASYISGSSAVWCPITCAVSHPKLPLTLRRTVTLPTYNLSSVWVLSPGDEASGPLMLHEGQSNVTIQLQVEGDVPRYQLACTKLDGPLPADMVVAGSTLWMWGPVELHHGGLYECQVSYFHHLASVQLEIQVIRLRQQPAFVSPRIATGTWEDGIGRAVECSAAGAVPAANVSWVLNEGLVRNSSTALKTENGTHSVTSTLWLPTCLPRGHQLECVIEHPSLPARETRPFLVPACKPPALHLSVQVHPTPDRWLAVCEVTGDVAAVSLSWLLPDKNTSQVTVRSGQKGGKFWTIAHYQFSLALHEGQNLTCQVRNEHISEERTVHIPQYYISSLRVVNDTSLSAYTRTKNSALQIVTLQTHLRNQRILFKVYGRVPTYNITCVRSDGSVALTEGGALVFPSMPSQKEAGRYVCLASFHHHHATTEVMVEVYDELLGHWKLIVICFSAATAIALILVVSLAVFCKKNSAEPSTSVKDCKKRESLAALTTLMQDNCSPELKKSLMPLASPGQKGQEYPELVSYSIVIDIKTTV